MLKLWDLITCLEVPVVGKNHRVEDHEPARIKSHKMITDIPEIAIV
jgi:hypothetical protein